MVHIFNVVVERDAVGVSSPEVIGKAAELRLAVHVVIVVTGDVCSRCVVGESKQKESEMNSGVRAAGRDVEAYRELRIPTAALSRSQRSPYQQDARAHCGAGYVEAVKASRSWLIAE